MALVKITVTCPCCKATKEEFDESQYDDKEKYLSYWNISFDSPEGEEAWKQKQSMTPREAPSVVSDIEGHISMADGTWVSSRSKHRENLKRNNCVEVGNDVPFEQKKVEFSRKEQEARKRQIAEITYSKLNYR
jgi:peroxiredoxin